MGFLRRIFAGGMSTPTPVGPRPAKNAAVPCPYLCGQVFDPAPKRGRKCPTCGQQFWVRHGSALTEAATERVDAADALERLGIDYYALEAELKAKDPNFGSPDVYWAGLGKMLLAALRKRDWSRAAVAYRAQAFELVRRGEPWLAVAREGCKMGARSFRNDEIRIIKGFHDKEICPACDADDGRVVGKNSEVESPSLPHADCIYGEPCDCSYEAAELAGIRDAIAPGR